MANAKETAPSGDRTSLNRDGLKEKSQSLEQALSTVTVDEEADSGWLLHSPDDLYRALDAAFDLLEEVNNHLALTRTAGDCANQSVQSENNEAEVQRVARLVLDDFHKILDDNARLKELVANDMA